MLNDISKDEDERRRILGPEYEPLGLWVKGLYRRSNGTRARQADDDADTNEDEQPLKKRKSSRNTS